jgi:hypothetical protein
MKKLMMSSDIHDPCWFYVVDFNDAIQHAHIAKLTGFLFADYEGMVCEYGLFDGKYRVVRNG